MSYPDIWMKSRVGHMVLRGSYYIYKNILNNNLIADATEVYDSIVTQTKDRFQFVGCFEKAKLLVSSNFHIKNTAANTYPFLNLKRLKIELQILYEPEDFRNISGLLALLNLLLDNK